MQQHISRNENYSLATITTSGYGIVVAHITVDTHQQNSVLDQAIQHVYPEALLSGAGKMSRDKFLGAVNLLGASVSTGISEGRLTITLRSTSEVFPKLLQLVSTMLTAPTFASSELKRIKTTVQNELHIKQEQSSVIAREQLRNSFYEPTDRRYAANTEHIVAALAEVDTKSLRAYHQKVLSSFWTCSMAAEGSSIAQFTKLIKGVKQAIAPMIQTGSHLQHAPKQQFLSKQISSKSNIDFSIGTPLPITIHHPDYVPVTFALGVLGIPGFAGRLMSTVRDAEGLTYSIYGYTESFSGTEQGYVRILTFFTPEKTLQGLTSTFREIKKFFRGGISQAEFETFQTIFKTKQTLLQDSLLKQLADLHTFNLNGFTIDEMRQFKDRLSTITRAQVNTVIKKYFNPKSFTISAAGPIYTVQKDIQSFLKNVT